MDNLLWFQRLPSLFEYERKALESKGFSLNQEQLKLGKVEFAGVVVVDGKEYRLLVKYPPGFPDFAPECYSSQFKDVRHQEVGTGKLCLYEDWKDPGSYILGEHAIERSITWINRQQTGFKTEEEIDGPEPRQYHRYAPSSLSSVLIPDEVLSSWESSEGTFTAFLQNYRTLHDGYPFCKGLVQRVQFDREEHVAPHFYDIFSQNLHSYEGKCFNVDEAPPYFKTQQEIVDWLEQKGHRDVVHKCKKLAKRHLQYPHNGFGPLLGIRYPDEDGKRGQIKHRFMIVSLPHTVPGNPKQKAVILPFFIIECKGISQDKLFNRVSDLRPLHDKHVVVVGLGTVGAPIALELAKAGVGKMTLVDFDCIDVGNVVRHICNLHHVGLPKVEAVQNVIISHNPYIHFNHPMFKNWGVTASDDEVADCIKSADLVVCAVGHSQTERYVDRMARMCETPVVYAFSSAGAWSGRAFRVIPRKTGCYNCHNHFIDKGGIPQFTAPEENREIYDNGCAVPAFPGTGIDTGIIANLASRLAIQTLLADQPNAYQPTEIDHIVWYSQGKNGQLEIVQKQVGQHEACQCSKS